MATYSVAEAKNRLPSLIDKALAGEEVIITRRGKPVVEVRPAFRHAAPATGTHERLRARRGGNRIADCRRRFAEQSGRGRSL